jgi:hypothetical protein
MSYTINKTDGSLLVVLPDGEVDENTTSVALIGRNTNAYGEYYNENLVVMLENFATNGVAPNAPLVGQLWYDTSDGRLKIYTPLEIFSPVGIATVSPSQPTSPNAGDLWIDSTNNQLNFSSNGISFVTVGPFNSSNATNKTGWYSENIGTGTFAVLYNKDKVVAIASSSTVSFTSPFDGMAGVTAGINLNTSIPGIRFVGTATNSIYADGIGTWTNTFVEKSPGVLVNQQINSSLTITQTLRVGDSIFAGTGYVANYNGIVIVANGGMSLTSDTGLSIGQAGNLQIYRNDAESSIIYYSTVQNDRHRFFVNDQYSLSGPVEAFELNPNDNNENSAKFFQNRSTSTVYIGDKLVVTNLTTTTDLSISSGLISLTPPTTDSKGIVLGSYSFLWKDATNAWTASDNIDLASSSSSYKIGGVDVVYQTSLGSAITSAPGLISAPALTSIGNLSSLTVGFVYISTNTISTTATGIDLVLDSLGSGNINVNNNKITNLSTGTVDTDATNKKYVDDKYDNLLSVFSGTSKSFIFSVDITGISAGNVDGFLISYLNTLAPISDGVYSLNTYSQAKIICTSVQSTTPPTILWLDKTVNPLTGDLTDVAGTSTTATFILNSISVTRTAKKFVVLPNLSGVLEWNWSSNISLPLPP